MKPWAWVKNQFPKCLVCSPNQRASILQLSPSLFIQVQKHSYKLIFCITHTYCLNRILVFVVNAQIIRGRLQSHALLLESWSTVTLLCSEEENKKQRALVECFFFLIQSSVIVKVIRQPFFHLAWQYVPKTLWCSLVKGLSKEIHQLVVFFIYL